MALSNLANFAYCAYLYSAQMSGECYRAGIAKHRKESSFHERNSLYERNF